MFLEKLKDIQKKATSGSLVLLREAERRIVPLRESHESKAYPLVSAVDFSTPLTSSGQLEEYIQTELSRIICKHLALSSEQFDIDTGFIDLGIDSISISTVLGEIKKTYAIDFPNTVILEHRNLREFSHYLAQNHGAEILAVLNNHDQTGVSATSVSATSTGDVSGDLSELPTIEGQPARQAEKEELEIKSLWEAAEREENAHVALPEVNPGQGVITGNPASLLDFLPVYTQNLITLPDGSTHEFLSIGQGSPILFISGLMTDAGWWYQLVDKLHSRNCSFENRLVFYHPPGHGQTDLAEDPETMEDVVEKLDAALWMLLPEDHSMPIVGWSLGGSIAQQLAISNLNRVSGLILVNTSPRGSEIIDWKDLMEDPGFGTDEVRRVLVESIGNADDRVISFYRKLFSNWNIEEQLESIECPACIIEGKEDTYMSGRYTEKLMARLSKASLRSLAGAGHFIPLTHPDFLKQAIDEIQGKACCQEPGSPCIA